MYYNPYLDTLGGKEELMQIDCEVTRVFNLNNGKSPKRNRKWKTNNTRPFSTLLFNFCTRLFEVGSELEEFGFDWWGRGSHKNLVEALLSCCHFMSVAFWFLFGILGPTPHSGITDLSILVCLNKLQRGRVAIILIFLSWVMTGSSDCMLYYIYVHVSSEYDWNWGKGTWLGTESVGKWIDGV